MILAIISSFLLSALVDSSKNDYTNCTKTANSQDISHRYPFGGHPIRLRFGTIHSIQNGNSVSV
jgi:hypothetical protein